MTGGLATLEHVEVPEEIEEPRQLPNGRRRFVAAVTAGMAIVSVPYLWVLWDLWTGQPSLLRWVGSGQFYDLQGRAILSGHLFLPNGAIGIEAFEHAGHQYTYFGLFPSLIRLPVLLFTNSYDAKLTAAALLLSWMATGCFSALLLWRVRILMRGSALLGRAEAASYGVLVAAITGGSVLVYLAAAPYVYNEDFAWSVALTLGSVFALLGVLERPSWGRVSIAGVLVLCTNLDRAPTGYACVIGALLVALWFFLGRDGQDHRRWVLPMVLVGLVPLAVSCVVTWIKFGLPFGLPMADQVWAHINAHRRYFLAANNGKAFSVRFIPSTAFAYLQPFGIRFGSVFPFITLPTSPAAAYGGVVLDQTYQTGSIPATMPLLFLLSCWGAITAFRRRQVGRVRLLRIPMLTAAAGVTGVLVWGYIAERYLADFLPLLVVASAVGLVDIWRRVNGRSLRFRWLTLTAITALAAFSVVANVAAAITPEGPWTSSQVNRFVSVQHLVTPGALTRSVEQGSAIPAFAPADQLFAVGDCAGLYLSTGVTFKDIPGQQDQRFGWIPVQQEAGINHTIAFKLNVLPSQIRQPVPLLSYGRSTLVLAPIGSGHVDLRVEDPGGTAIAWPPPSSPDITALLRPSVPIDLSVMTDPYLHRIAVKWVGGGWLIEHYLAGPGTAQVMATGLLPGGGLPPVSVADIPVPAVGHLCQQILLTLKRSGQGARAGA
jgi:hypothetical protein